MPNHRPPVMGHAKKLFVALSCAGLLSLQACGGGGEGTSSSTNYVTWANNANGTVIVDANNQRLSVSKVDRSVVMGPNEITLTGTKVDTNGNVTYNGTLIGTVSPTTSTAGSTIAMFKCTDGSAMSFALNGNSYTYSCASANSGTQSNGGSSNSNTSGGSGSGSSNSGSGSSSSGGQEPALQCISVSRTPNNWATMTNNCGYTVTVGWCYANSSDCKYGTWGTTSKGNIGPGASRSASTFISKSNEYVLLVLACTGTDTSISEPSEGTFVCGK